MTAIPDPSNVPMHSETANTGEEYDLIVGGGGISGLAAAHFYWAKAPKAAS